MKFARKKPRNTLLSFFYKFDKLLPLSKQRKLKFYLDLEWIFERLAHEQSFKVFKKNDHPVRKLSQTFLQKYLKPSDNLLDLGCNNGDLTFQLSQFVTSITGIDKNENLLAEAVQNHASSKITFIKDDVSNFLEKTDRHFEVLILSHILEHLEDPGKLLRSFKDKFQYMYVEVPDFERTHLNIYRKALDSKLIYSDGDHIWEFDRQSMQQLIIDSGLTIQDMEFVLGVQKYWCSTQQ